MKKLFISQPMKGKTDEEILMERKAAIKEAEKLVGEPVEVIDSFFQSAPADAKTVVVFGEVFRIAFNSRCGIFCSGLAGGQRVQDRA